MEQLKRGVHLHVIPTKKFKTVRILIRFTSPLLAENITKRTLLSSLMETNCLAYPTLTDMSQKLAEMYGSSFGISVSKKGNQHYFSINLSMIDEHLLQNKVDLLKESVQFLREIIFSPNIQHGQFDEATFQREKENLQHYFESIVEDKQTYASLSLQELYFEPSPNQKIPSFGTLEELSKETSASIAEYYEQMLKEDIVDIIVLGDVNKEELYNQFDAFPFLDREMDGKPEIFYQQEPTNLLREKQEQQPVLQSKLNLGFYTGIYFHDADFFPLQVFNGLFGAFPHSKLFMNVREKESMAYYASSYIDTFRGFMGVQTGIDAKNRERVMQLIHEQIDKLIIGDITDLEMEQTKRLLKNSYLLSLDSNQSLMEKAFLADQLPQSDLSDEQWMKQVDLVTVADVKRIAKKIKLQALYFLEGGE